MPGLAALGGMLVPALICIAVNRGHPETLAAWTIPSATDMGKTGKSTVPAPAPG